MKKNIIIKDHKKNILDDFKNKSYKSYREIFTQDIWRLAKTNIFNKK